VAGDAETWEKAVVKIRSGMMPPSGARRPTRRARCAGVRSRNAWTGPAVAGLDAPAMHRPTGRVRNAIRDLLALDVDVAVLLPADASTTGSATSPTLGVSPSTHQGYVTAARISRRAIGDRTLTPTQVTYPARRLPRDRHIEGLPLTTLGGMLVKHLSIDAGAEASITGGIGLAAGRRRGRRHARRGEDRDDDAAELSRQRDRRTAHDRRGPGGPRALGPAWTRLSDFRVNSPLRPPEHRQCRHRS
jgi:hypothetical protein